MVECYLVSLPGFSILFQFSREFFYVLLFAFYFYYIFSPIFLYIFFVRLLLFFIDKKRWRIYAVTHIFTLISVYESEVFLFLFLSDFSLSFVVGFFFVLDYNFNGKLKEILRIHDQLEGNFGFMSVKKVSKSGV